MSGRSLCTNRVRNRERISERQSDCDRDGHHRHDAVANTPGTGSSRPRRDGDGFADDHHRVAGFDLVCRARKPHGIGLKPRMRSLLK